MDRTRQHLTQLMTRSPSDVAAVRDGCYFDIDAARRVRKFFRRYLRHSKGQFAGKRFSLMRWQWRELIMPLFGWKRADGSRRFRIAYIEVPKKNGKSTILSGIALYMLLADKEPGAEVYSAAADRDQASIVYNEAKNMMEASEALSAHLDPVHSRKRIIHHSSKSFYQVLSSEVNTKEGLNIHCLLFDELHAQPNRDLFDALRYGGASRRQPLLISITTAGYDRNSICWEQHDYAQKVLDGIIEDTAFFAFIRAADTEADWTNPETWYQANPSLDVTINLEDFAADCREAKESSAKENSFRRYRLNQWTEQDVRWLNMDRWDKCGSEDPAGWRATTLAELQGKPCYGGLDLSTTTDLTALALVFPVANGYRVIPWFWVPGERAHERERKDRVPYQLWGKQGFIKLTPGNVIDYDIVRADINELRTMFDIRELAVDRWNATQLLTQLEGDGATVAAHGMGYKDMTAPTKELEKLLLADRIEHGGNPVLRWNASNVTVEMDAAGNLKPSKAKSTERIDGISALIMALGRAMLRPVKQGSIYETREPLFVGGDND